MVATYVALALVALSVALGLRPLWRRGEPRASWPILLGGALLIGTSASLFMALKIAIPSVAPFWLDRPLAGAEAAMFGKDPYLLLDAAFGRVTLAVDRIYGVWLPVQLVVLFSLLAAPPSRAKAQALTAYAAAWFLIGIVAAALLSSAGPIFFDRVFGGDQFAALRHVLEARGAWMVLHTSDAMWSSQLGARPGLVAGISAAPSMHVAVSLWILLAARRLAARAVPLAAAYLAFIWVASVQLGWHYVSDGFLGILGMTALWWLAGRLPYRSPSEAPA
jgi:hypothetical protein